MVADLAVEKAARREKAVAANANDPSSISSSSSSAASRPTSALELNALATRMVNAEALVAAPRGAAAARAAAPGGGGGEGHGGSHGGAQALLPRVHLTPILLAAQYGHLQVCNLRGVVKHVAPLCWVLVFSHILIALSLFCEVCTSFSLPMYLTGIALCFVHIRCCGCWFKVAKCNNLLMHGCRN